MTVFQPTIHLIFIWASILQRMQLQGFDYLERYASLNSIGLIVLQCLRVRGLQMSTFLVPDKIIAEARWTE